jgi:multiple sugar transport system permease protein
MPDATTVQQRPPSSTEGRAPSRRSGRRSPIRPRHLFLVPAAVFLGTFSLFPLIQLARMSVSAVTSATLNQQWDFVGLGNLGENMASGDLWAALVTTGVFVVVVTAVGMGGGLAAALALRTSSRWSGFLLGLMVFVWALPPVVNGSVWKFLLADAGLYNAVARAIGLTDTALPFLYDSSWALGSVAFVNSWAVIPFNALVFRAAILNIPPDIFEAARVDGASRWQEIRHIVLPTVRPTSLVLLVLTVVYAFRSFDFIYVMTYGGPGNATTTLPFLAYLQAFERFNFGLGASTAMVALVLVFGMAVVYATSIRREEAQS